MVEKKQIIDEVRDYFVNVIEVPKEQFSGFAVCPFAKPERVRNKLDIDVFDPTQRSFPDRIQQMIDDGYSSIALALFENKVPVLMDKSETSKFSRFLNKVMRESGIRGYKNICFNPNDEVNIDGFNPRALSPYFLIVVSKLNDLDKGRKSLTKTKYYDNMNNRYKKFLNLDL